MSNFIILGLIPGTNIQIGLVGWVISFTLLLGCLYVIRRERRKQTLRFILIQLSLSLSLHRQ